VRKGVFSCPLINIARINAHISYYSNIENPKQHGNESLLLLPMKLNYVQRVKMKSFPAEVTTLLSEHRVTAEGDGKLTRGEFAKKNCGVCGSEVCRHGCRMEFMQFPCRQDVRITQLCEQQRLIFTHLLNPITILVSLQVLKINKGRFFPGIYYLTSTL
jgi:hypothetical protein